MYLQMGEVFPYTSLLDARPPIAATPPVAAAVGSGWQSILTGLFSGGIDLYKTIAEQQARIKAGKQPKAPKQPPVMPQPPDNTMKYVLIGAGVLLALGVMGVFAMKKSN